MTSPRSIDQLDGLAITDNAAGRRYEARLDGELAGAIDYLPHDRWIVLDHTEVLRGFEGRGIGARLAKAALDDIRARGLFMTPTCPFVAAYVKRHPEYADLVVGVRGPRDPTGGDPDSPVP
jgi:predicted GNAT family acetyltransferase